MKLRNTINSFKRLCRYYYRYIALNMFFIFTMHPIGFAQNGSCKDVLETANREYETGRLQACLDLLNPCLHSVSRNEMYEAYRLISLSNLFENRTELAENAAIQLLKRKPDYRKFPFLDPVEFTKLLSQYDVWPKLELGVSVSLNVNSVHLLKSYNVIRTEGEYRAKAGFRAGVLGEYFLNKRGSVNAELMYELLNYSSHAANVGGHEQTYNENLRYMSVPMSYRYYILDYKHMRLSVDLGVQSQFLLGTNSNMVLINNELGTRSQDTRQDKNQRTLVLFSGIVGTNLKYPIGNGSLLVSAHYAYGFSNVVKSSQRWNSLGFITANQYVDSDITFIPFYFTVGYQLPVRGMNSVKKTSQ